MIVGLFYYALLWHYMVHARVVEDLCEKPVFWRKCIAGACVSRAQAGMGYYLGGAPLVTREWIILSDIPWVVAGQ